jgi:hypothetical protein
LNGEHTESVVVQVDASVVAEGGVVAQEGTFVIYHAISNPNQEERDVIQLLCGLLLLLLLMLLLLVLLLLMLLLLVLLL